ncbi:RNA-directed DNA polymerase, eukaryota [Tanacetum coccineum]
MGDNDWHEVTRKKHRSVFQPLDFRGFRGSFPQRSKEDQVTHISKSVFVTNFLENFESNDLWKICEGYGWGYGSVDWKSLNHLDWTVSTHANQLFLGTDQRIPSPTQGMDCYYHAPVGFLCSIAKDNSTEDTFKYFNSIPNLRTTLAKEGFSKVKLTYLGGLWVMIELNNEVTMQKLLQHIGVKSWFHVLQAAKPDFVSEERIVWVDIEGIPLNLWTRETFSKIGAK